MYFFPETFRFGEFSRVHLHLTGGSYLSTQAFVVGVNGALVSNNGKDKYGHESRYSAKDIFPSYENGGKNTYVFGVNLSLPDANLQNAYDESRLAELTLEISTKKIIDENKRLYSDPVEIVKTDPINVVILPFQALSK